MWALPLVYRANASTIARPIPEVPPMKTATGRYVRQKVELDAFAAASEGMGTELIKGREAGVEWR
jgi:hypothetical protein